MRRIPLVLLLALIVARPSAGQESRIGSRQPPELPDIDLYVLGGPTHRSAIIWPQRHQFPRQLRLEFGAAVHVSRGRHWAIVTDVTTSALEGYWQWDTDRPASPDDNFSKVRRVTITPSIVRVWRMGPVSAHFGGGLGIERQFEFNRYRMIESRVKGKPVVADTYTEEDRDSVFLVPFVIRGGAVVDVPNGLAVRVSYLIGIRYFDAPSSRSFDMGLGYRFGGR